MVKVLHVFSFFRPDFTGEGVYFEKIRVHFDNSGIENDVLAVKTRDRAASPSRSCGVGDVAYLGLFDNAGIAVSFKLACWLIAHARQYDTVHFHAFADRYFAGHLICKLFGLRTLQSCTLDDSPDNIVTTYRTVWQWLIRLLIRLPDTYITISPQLYNAARTIVPAARVCLIPQGVEIPERAQGPSDEMRRSQGYSPDDIVLLFVGGICERKGVDFLIENMPRLLKHNENVKLLIVGPDLEDDYAENVRNRVDALGLTANVRFCGAVDDVSPIYRFCDMMVFPSHLEGFGNVLLEAMAHELPVVSRRLRGVTDSFITDRETGLLFDNDDEYIAGVQKLIADQEYRKKIGNAALEAVTRDYKMSDIASRYVELYTNTVNANDD